MEDRIISSFYTKKDLNPDIWMNNDNVDESEMRPEIRDGLLSIANEFLDFLGFDIFVQDVTMTGSLANFNWSEYSDIDLHIIYDFKENDEQEELFKDLFNLKRTVFNSQHDITVKGYEVETYVQDMNEPHMSTGVYSILYNEWLTQPKPESVKINREEIQKKAQQWMDIIDTVIEDIQDEELDDALEKIDSVKDKIKKYRSCGLEKGGEYSNENLVFKYLRRNGYIQKLFDTKNNFIDYSLSIQENYKQS